MVIKRARYLKEIRRGLARSPVCALLGPRQCGKTTLARQFASSRRDVHFFDLERAADMARLSQPEHVLSQLQGLVVIDEIQRMPALYATLRPLVDRPGVSTRFLVLGSASPDLVRGVSESLAGRVSFVDLAGFDLNEIGLEHLNRVWLRGGFPRSYLSRTDKESLSWRDDLIRTLLERDLPQLGIRIPSETLRRFWMMLAHYHGQIWNGAELARAFGVGEHTVRHYLEILAGAFLLRLLPPWFENIGKRQYKAPKIYVRDSGLLHALLGLGTQASLQSHPKYGASWEGFALEQVLVMAGGRDAFYWGTHAGAELDLLLLRGARRYGIELKCADAPSMTKSVRIAIEDLHLDRVWIVYPGESAYRMHDRVEVVPVSHVLNAIAKLR